MINVSDIYNKYETIDDAEYISNVSSIYVIDINNNITQSMVPSLAINDDMKSDIVNKYFNSIKYSITECYANIEYNKNVIWNVSSKDLFYKVGNK